MHWSRLTPLALLFLAACNPSPVGPSNPEQFSTAIDSFGANPNPSPLNIGVSFSWTAFGRDLVCTLDAEGDGSIDYTVQNCSSQSRIVHTYGSQGAYDARLTVTGADGKTVERTTPVVVSAPNTPPTIPSLTPAPPPSSSNPLAVRFTWVVADFDADITRCKFDAESDGIWDFDDLCSGLPASSSVGKAATTTFSFDHPYRKPGSYEATLEAADPYVATRSRVKIRVPFNRAPVIEALKTTTGNNFSATLGFTVSDPDNDPLSCKLTVQGIGTFQYPNCKTLTRTFTFPAAGIYGVTLEVSDGLSKTTQSTTISFDGGPPPFKFVQISSSGTREGSTYLDLEDRDHNCALGNNGRIYCWGDGSYGQLGTGYLVSPNNLYQPTLVTAGTAPGIAFTQVTSGTGHTCALDPNGAAYCWGHNSLGELGDGILTTPSFAATSDIPVTVAGGITFKQISGGYSWTCGLDTQGAAYCWGRNGDGQLGQGSTDNNAHSTPLAVTGGHYFDYLAPGIGSNYVCAIDFDAGQTWGDAYCWGSNIQGSLGVGTSTSNYTVPTLVAGSHKFSHIATGSGHSCGIDSGGDGYCWGYGYSGNLGNGKDASNCTPGPTCSPTNDYWEVSPVAVVMPSGVKFARIAVGNEVSCAVGTDGAAYCWGNGGYYGVSGNGTSNDSNIPVAVTMPASTSFVDISMGLKHTCALTTVGTVFCWGKGTSGQVGDGGSVGRNVPTAALMPNP